MNTQNVIFIQWNVIQPENEVISYLLVWLLPKTKITTADKVMWRNWKPHRLLVRMQNGVDTMENSMAVLKKKKKGSKIELPMIL